MYTTEMFENATKAIDGYAGIRDVHIGLDIGGPAGTPVHAPAEGVIQSFGYNPEADWSDLADFPSLFAW